MDHETLQTKIKHLQMHAKTKTKHVKIRSLDYSSDSSIFLSFLVAKDKASGNKL